MLDEKVLKNLLEKTDFVAGISEVVKKANIGVTKLEYKVFVHKSQHYKREYLVVTYVGGAVCPRNCTGNSCLAILGEIYRLVDSCYWAEIDSYNAIVGSPEDWEELSA